MNSQMESQENRWIYLISSENTRNRIGEKEIAVSGLISNMIEDDDSNNEIEIPLPHSDFYVKKVVSFCEHHASNPLQMHNGSITNGEVVSKEIFEYVGQWYADLVDLEVDALFDLLKIADHLHIEPLIELCCLKVATIMKNSKDAGELSKNFNIENDFTEEERQKFTASHSWYYENAK